MGTGGPWLEAQIWRAGAGAATAMGQPPGACARPAGRLQAAATQTQGTATMAIERTFSIIKPDATRRNLTGKINAIFETNGLAIVAQKRIHMTEAQAKKFYEVHAARPFYNDLVSFMTSGPVVVQVLEGENAVAKNRELMGATNPANAAEGTIRKLFAESIEANSVHGSDSAENAAIEIAYFFAGCEIVA
jgi:nucleoside-diphosphate kinase